MQTTRIRALSSAVERRIADPEVTGSIPVVPFKNPWRNGSASDSRPEGWGFKSLWVQFELFVVDWNTAQHGRHWLQGT